MRTILFHAMLITTIAVAEDDPIVPRPPAPQWTSVKADADGRVWLRVPGDKAASEWELIDRVGAYLDVPPGATVAVFSATRPGTYRVIAVAEGKLVRYAVSVGGDPPGPMPPKPPSPPDDPLVRRLQAAYDADGSATKSADLKQLIALYLEAAEFARKSDCATAADLFGAVSAAAAALLPDVDGVRRLAGVRKVIGTELVNVLPTDPAAPLTAEVRAAAVGAFAKYAAALGGVVP